VRRRPRATCAARDIRVDFIRRHFARNALQAPGREAAETRAGIQDTLAAGFDQATLRARRTARLVWSATSLRRHLERRWTPVLARA
jgi:hypothetical protein